MRKTQINTTRCHCPSKTVYYQRDKDGRGLGEVCKRETLLGTMWVGTHIHTAVTSRGMKAPGKIPSLLIGALFTGS